MTTVCAIPECQKEAKTIALLIGAERGFSESAYCNEHLRSLGLPYEVRDPTRIDVESLGRKFDVCRLYAVFFANETQRYSFVLRSNESGSFLACETGYVQACSLYGAIKAPDSATLLTYQLFAHMVDALNGSVLEALVDGFDRISKMYTFQLLLQTSDGHVSIKCRGSDAIGIAHSANRPIKVDVALLGRST